MSLLVEMDGTVVRRCGGGVVVFVTDPGYVIRDCGIATDGGVWIWQVRKEHMPKPFPARALGAEWTVAALVE